MVVEGMIACSFGEPGAKAYTQSFSFDALRDLTLVHDDLGVDIPQVVLGIVLEIDDEFGLAMTSFELLSLADIALFATRVGVGGNCPALGEEFISTARSLEMLVHAYMFNIADLDGASARLQPYLDAGLDGFFSNFADSVVGAVNRAAVVPLPATGLLCSAPSV